MTAAPAHTAILNRLRGGIVASVQAAGAEPLNDPDVLGRIADSAVSGGAVALRMAGLPSIAAFRQRCPGLPVMGITKPAVIPADYSGLVYITPTYADAAMLAAAGVEIVAMDATARPRPQGETLADIVARMRAAFPHTALMADIATVSEGEAAASLGFDLISTTLSGYTTETLSTRTDGPDFALLDALVNNLQTPVVLEGRIWEPQQVAEGFARGAHCVVIGSAISRPHEIVRRFAAAAPTRP